MSYQGAQILQSNMPLVHGGRDWYSDHSHTSASVTQDVKFGATDRDKQSHSIATQLNECTYYSSPYGEFCFLSCSTVRIQFLPAYKMYKTMFNLNLRSAGPERFLCFTPGHMSGYIAGAGK